MAALALGSSGLPRARRKSPSRPFTRFRTPDVQKPVQPKRKLTDRLRRRRKQAPADTMPARCPRSSPPALLQSSARQAGPTLSRTILARSWPNGDCLARGDRMSAFMHVHLIALRYFGETVRHGSMRQAAETLHVAASAINRQILKLEDQLQCKLFERLPEGVRLTAAGEVLYRYILGLERDLSRAIAEIDDLRGLRRGHVAISCEDGVARDFLPGVLSEFHRNFPRVTYRSTSPPDRTLSARSSRGRPTSASAFSRPIAATSRSRRTSPSRSASSPRSTTPSLRAGRSG